MTRALLFILKLAIVIAVAVWLVSNPGSVEIAWQGYVIETTVGILILAALVVVAVGVVLYRTWRGIRRAPGAIRGRRQSRRRERGYRALTQGMVAVAAGDAEAAKRFARKADGLLNDPPLTMLLSAQAAQLNGDETAAGRYFTSMLDRPDTAFLGVRGLLTQAIKRGDGGEALRLARRAHDLHPRTPWVLGTLFDLEARSGDWKRAEQTLREAMKAGAIATETGRHHRAALLLERSFEADVNGLDKEAQDLAQKAHDIVPGWAPAAARLARLLNRAGKPKPAMKTVERAWRVAPHPDLAAAYGEIGDETDPLSRVKRLERLHGLNADSVEGRIALARAAIDARLWGSARGHLNRALAIEPGARVYRLFAELEQAEHGGGAARDWLSRAADAPPDVTWVCLECNATAPQWRGICTSCGAFDSLAWKAPTAGPRLVSPETVTGLPTLVDRSSPLPVITIPGERRPPMPDDAPEKTAANGEEEAETAASTETGANDETVTTPAAPAVPPANRPAASV